MKPQYLLSLFVLSLLISCGSGPTQKPLVQDPPTPTRLSERLTPSPQEATSLGSAPDWQLDQVFYHVWLSAFADSDGDGVGDIPGLISRLEYLSEELGVTALWLSPFFENASGLSNLHGYDVTNHFRVDPRFGSTEDVKTLLREAHSRGMRLIFDFVPNHVSNRHPWFIDSAKGTNSPYRDWFWWEAQKPKGWTGWDQSSDFYSAGGSYYYGVFWNGMPDLNYNNPEVRQTMSDAALYWLNMGFDGIRMDAVKYLFEDRTTGGSGFKDQPATIQYFQSFRQEVLDPFTALGFAKFMVAENWDSDYDNLISYMEDGKGNRGFHMTLDFPLAYRIKDSVKNPASSGAPVAEHWEAFTNYLPASASLGTFLSNHDNVLSRPFTEYQSVQGSQTAAALLLLGPGTPFIYYGNEIGMQGLAGNDTRLRTPMDWEAYERQKNAPDSLFNGHKELIHFRRSRISLRKGSVESLTGLPENLMGFVRTWENEKTLVLINMGSREQKVEPPQGAVLLGAVPAFGARGQSPLPLALVASGVLIFDLSSDK